MAKSKLSVNQVITSGRNSYTIVKALNDTGSQGGIYLASDKSGQSCVLKWYWRNDAAQSGNIEKMTQSGLPEQLMRLRGIKFLWPLDYVSNNESFGYILEYIDTSPRYNYESVMIHEGKGGALWDHEFLCRMSLILLEGFHKLHASGYCFMDVSRDNISFSDAGDIVVFDPDCIRVNDPDELDPAKKNSPVDGTPGFIAPEILRRENNPNTRTDLWQLSVLLFLLWVKHHPLDGELVLEDEKYNDINLLSKDPKFIFDRAKKDNCVEGDMEEFGYVNTWWLLTPEPMREMFLKAFTTGCDPQNRLFEFAWKNAIDDVRANYLGKCPSCGRLVNKYAQLCICCRKPLPKQHPPVKAPVAANPTQAAKPPSSQSYTGVCLLVFEEGKRVKTIPIKNSAVFYGRDLSKMLDGKKKYGSIVESPQNPSIIGLRNETSTPWTCIKADGKSFTVGNGSSMIIKHRNKFIIETDSGKVGISIFDFG
ncbi:MAG: hypothetical protein LBU32_03810 [Clostridiales bacterium]|jgi:serine/threonine protein kinase|nr:hypothetical protein [Clostridiales bacterium]